MFWRDGPWCLMNRVHELKGFESVWSVTSIGHGGILRQHEPQGVGGIGQVLVEHDPQVVLELGRLRGTGAAVAETENALTLVPGAAEPPAADAQREIE